MKQPFFTGLLCVSALTTAAFAQAPPPSPVEFEAQLAAWRAEHGSSWRVTRGIGSGRVELIHGGNAAGPIQPRSDAEWFGLARHFLAETSGLQHHNGGSFVDGRVSFLPLGQVNSTDKYAVRLTQEIGGVPVEDAAINMIFSTDGRLLALHTNAVSGLEGASTSPGLSADAAARAAVAHFSQSFGAPTEIGSASLIFARVGTNDEATLAWQLELFQRYADTKPTGLEYAIDARTGALLETEQLVHDFDVRGTVMMNATPGTAPDTAGNPEVQFPVPFARVTSSAGTLFADENGDFNYVGVNTNLDVTAEFRGTFNNVNNQAGADHAVTQSLPPNQNNTILLNPGTGAQVTAQANCYNGAQAVRDYVRRITPTDSTSDFVIVSNPNLTQTCNAFFDGGSINFFQSGGGCVNTAYSTVVAHELGHWLNVRYGTGNNSSGMGEGNADVFAMYTYDVPQVGQGFSGGGNIRSGNNTRQWCGTGCYGQVHADGEVWMGAAWKVRRNLNTTHGNAMGDLIADTLFMGWMNGFNQADIAPIIEEQWLTLDDDDGNTGNGTPNYGDIDSAFREQGFPGVDLDFIQITNVTTLADTMDEAGPYTVDADIVALLSPPVASANLRYRVNGGALQSIAMGNIGGDTYRASLPGVASPARVEYFVEGTDSAAQDGSNVDEPDNSPFFRVGLTTILVETNFNGEDGGFSSGAAGDNATTGIWVRANPVGTAAQPEDDHSVPGVQCWFTGNAGPGGGLGDNDVDGGTTTLLSDTYDMTGLFAPQIRYWRWYSNQTNGVVDDTFLIDISDDGGANWTSVETIGPGGAQSNGGWFRNIIDVSAFVSLTNQVQVRYRASDLGNGSIVEAAIDDVIVDDVAPGNGCPAPSNYCVNTANSSGASATIAAVGSQVVADNTFGVSASGAPANNSGLFFYGAGQGQIPFGDGFRCVAGTIFRLNPVTMTDGAGQVTRVLDLNNPPAAGGQITAGSTWNFQFWFRDPMGPGGNGFNLTDGVSVPFCP